MVEISSLTLMPWMSSYQALDEHHEIASWHEWVGVAKIGWHEETNGHES